MTPIKMAKKRMRMVLLGIPPSLGAAAGAAMDEWQHLGFSTWRSACRAGGVSFASLLSFTWQLLPNAIIGLLLGGLAVQVFGFVLRERGNTAAECAAAHLGCLLAMPLGLVLCAQALPALLMPFADVALAAAGGLLVLLLIERRETSRAHQ
jgi:hypothetical protein